jgi:hypothetical protein
LEEQVLASFGTPGHEQSNSSVQVSKKAAHEDAAVNAAAADGSDGKARHHLDCAVTFSLAGKISHKEQKQQSSSCSHKNGNTLFDPGFALQLPAGFIECDVLDRQ